MMNKRTTIFDNYINESIFCCEMIEQAKEFYESNPKRCGNKAIRDRVEIWLKEEFLPAFELAIDKVFESEEFDSD